MPNPRTPLALLSGGKQCEYCERKHYARGCCKKHYKRLLSHGNPKVNRNSSGRNHHQFKHGMTGTRLYIRWKGMKRRCEKPTDPAYHRYGGRGITVCKRWQSFANFASDMGPSFRQELSIERIDNDKGYSPDNCEWKPIAEQQSNKKGVVKYSFNGETSSIAQWARRIGMKRATLQYRLQILKWPIEQALTIPVSLANHSLRP